MLDGVESPSRNDEYLFYQVLLGVWPLGETAASDQLRDRLRTYMLKAAREAKESTSWAHQNTEYENALTTFVDAALDPVRSQEFLSDFVQLQRWVAAIGALNSLSRTLIKFTAPGVPDTYQGNELLDFSLVDPDNRRPVDYTQREKLLAEVSSIPANKQRCFLRELTKDPNNPTDLQGRAKLWLTWKLLQARIVLRSLPARRLCSPCRQWRSQAQGIVAFGRRMRMNSL